MIHGATMLIVALVVSRAGAWAALAKITCSDPAAADPRTLADDSRLTVPLLVRLRGPFRTSAVLKPAAARPTDRVVNPPAVTVPTASPELAVVDPVSTRRVPL